MKAFSTCLLAVVCFAVVAAPAPAYSQGGGFFATVSGTVVDSSGALIPGVTITATAVDTGVVTTILTNEAGAYNLPNLLPGRYTISAALSGFQTRTYTDVQLSQNTSYRYNFELTVANVATQVEVSISAEALLTASGATVGQVLTEQRVRDLPIVGNNVLDLITVMAGVENIIPTNPPSALNAFGRENTTFAGISARDVTIARDGIMVQDVRFPTGINSATTINPDLVGEIRLILSPVDAEMGRGNGSIQISTRSGTNRYTGSAVWSFRNTGLDPNTWTNNRNQTVPVGSPPGTVPQAIQRDWANVHQGTVTFGGPIIRNKTFFFALYDQNETRQRTTTQTTVLTPCARLGIFRYYEGWNNGNNGIFAITDTNPTNPSRPSVNADGTPSAPTTFPDGSPHPGVLQHRSVFGPLASQPTQLNCSDAAVDPNTLRPTGTTGSWDGFRTQIDPTGFIARTLQFMPQPNNYEIGDGLNTAGFRWQRRYTGLDNLFGVGEATGNRKQINVKIDHNFSANHKGNVNVSYERVNSDDVVAAWPNTFSNQNFRRPIVVTAGFTSTLSATVVNEARFGLRKTGTNVVAPWDREETRNDVRAYLPPDVNGFLLIPRIQGGLPFCYPHSGVRPPGGCATALGGGPAAPTNTAIDDTPVYTFADTLSWTRGAHAFKFGGEARIASSETKQSGPVFFGANLNFVQANGGTISGTAPLTSGSSGIVGFNPSTGQGNPAFLNLQGGTAGTARNILNFLSASVATYSHFYFITDPNDLTTWSDYRTHPLWTSKILQKEFSAFFKDDWKVSRNLTLNLGLRWEYYGVPYIGSGLTVAPIGGGSAAFGYSGRDFTGWMRPGQRGDLTNFEFVGPNSPNPDRTVYPNDWNNFGPAIGFAWQVPWFGEGRTTVRGGYQVTFQGGGRFNALQAPLGSPPGSTLEATFQPQNVYLDLTSVTTPVGSASSAPIPVPPTVAPMQPLPVSNRSQTFTAFDPNYVSPYVQNLTLSVTRSVNRNVTVDVRYVGTLSRKQYSTTNLNLANFLYNGLLDEFNRVRTGTEITKTASDPKSLLDQIFNQINLCAGGPPSPCVAGTYGPIGTTVGGVYQSAALQMRSSNTFRTNLANGNFVALANSINTFNYVASAHPSLPTPVGQGAALRANGFPENFVVTNPQFGTMNYLANNGYSNYHSMQAQVTLRPLHGFSGQATYTWSKNLGLNYNAGAGNITNPVERHLDYTNILTNPGHSLRTNGTVELPIGPNKLFFGNTSGWVARLIERWNLGVIYNLSSGAPVTITAANMLYANGVPDIVRDIDLNELKGVRWDIPLVNNQGSFLEGRYFDNNDVFVKVQDPQCSTVTTLQNLHTTGTTPTCTLNAVAMVVPAGTAGSFLIPNDAQGRSAVYVLQNPLPGMRGNLGQSTVIGLGSWRFDANLSKTFTISESKSLAVRIDAQNVLNHPQPGNPNLSINNNVPFGQITTKTGNRLLQGQLRLNF